MDDWFCRPGRHGRPSKFQGFNMFQHVSTCFNMFQPNQTFSDIDHDHLPDTDGSAKSPLVALRCLPMGRQGQSPEMLGLPHLHGPSVSSKSRVESSRRCSTGGLTNPCVWCSRSAFPLWLTKHKFGPRSLRFQGHLGILIPTSLKCAMIFEIGI